jgi:hypothetical protein
MQAQTPDGERLWTITAANATGKLGAEGDTAANLDNVVATFYERNKPSINVKAKSGRANELSGKLSLWGDVSAVSPDGQTSLTCDKITWQRDDRLLVATGKVAAEANGLRVGPASEARASFRSKDGNMKPSSTAALVLSSLALFGPDISFRDRAGNMEVTGLKRFTGRHVEEGDKYVFEGIGSPFVAKWLKQGLTVYGERIEGTLLAVLQGSTLQSSRLVRGRFTGNTRAVLAGKTGNMDLTGLTLFEAEQAEAGRAWQFKGDGAPFVAKFPDNGIVLTGRHFDAMATLTDDGGSQVMELTTGKFTGGVKATISQKEKKTGKTFSLTASCPTVTIDRAERTIVLSGGVHISGDHPSLGPGGAEGDAARIRIEFDPDMKTIRSLTMEEG